MAPHENYSPQRAKPTQKRKQRHPFRIILILIVVLFLGFFAVQVKRYLTEPIMPRTDTAQTADSSDTGANSAPDTGSVSNADSSGSDVGNPTGADSSGDIDLLMLVNSTHDLPDGYDVTLTTLSNGQQVAQIIYPELQQMFDDARAQGIYPVVASGYRTAEKQQSLMDEKVQSLKSQGYSESDAKTEALKWVNAVGYSEHQSGLAVDINADGVHSAGWQVYNWLADNAWQYGFILRYPDGKTDITGTGYEPWHYRYVGRDAATEIHAQGVCLEEYLGEVN